MTKSTEKFASALNKPQIAEANPPHEEIELRAYLIYLERGGAPGNDVEDWLEAEHELLEKYTKPRRMAKAGTI